MKEQPRSIVSVRLAYDLANVPDPAKFYDMNSFLFEQAEGFFNKRLGSREERLPARLFVFKGAIQQVREVRQDPAYKSWLDLSPKLAAARGERALILTPENVKLLHAVGDPAVHAVAVMEKIRQDDFPNLKRELVKVGEGGDARYELQRMDELYDTYDIFVNGVHAKTDFLKLTQSNASPKGAAA